VNNTENKSFVSVGVTILDIVGCHINSVPEQEQNQMVDTIHLCAAGTAAAPAVIAARNGLKSTLIGAVGKDSNGEFVTAQIAREGVNTDLMQQRDDMPTASTILAINDQGKRPTWHMAGAFLMLELTDEMRSVIVKADHIHWGGIGLLFNIDGEIAASVLAEAKANGAIITADLMAPGDHTLDCIKAIASSLDYFMPSICEALEISATDTVEAAAEFFMELGIQTCVIKCGGDGAYIANREGLSEYIPVIDDVDVVDTSGCGDSFCAGFNVGLANGFDPIKACRFAAATAAQVASAPGSDAAVKDYQTTLRLMEAGSMKVLQEGRM